MSALLVVLAPHLSSSRSDDVSQISGLKTTKSSRKRKLSGGLTYQTKMCRASLSLSQDCSNQLPFFEASRRSVLRRFCPASLPPSKAASRFQLTLTDAGLPTFHSSKMMLSYNTKRPRHARVVIWLAYILNICLNEVRQLPEHTVVVWMYLSSHGSEQEAVVADEGEPGLTEKLKRQVGTSRVDRVWGRRQTTTTAGGCPRFPKPKPKPASLLELMTANMAPLPSHKPRSARVLATRSCACSRPLLNTKSAPILGGGWER